MNETAPVSAPSIPDEPGVVSPDLYPLADALMRFRRQDCVIDIGCQDVERLGRLPARRTIGLCSGAHLQKSRTLLPEAEWLEADLGLDVEAGLELAERLPANAVVLCAALAGDGGPPAGLAALIKALLQRGGAVIACSTIAGTSGDGGLDGRRKAADQVAALINAGLPVTAYSLSPGDPGSRGGGVLISLHDGAAPEDLAPAAEGLAFDDLSHLILGLGEFTHFSEPDPPASHTASPLRPLLPALVRAEARQWRTQLARRSAEDAARIETLETRLRLETEGGRLARRQMEHFCARLASTQTALASLERAVEKDYAPQIQRLKEEVQFERRKYTTAIRYWREEHERLRAQAGEFEAMAEWSSRPFLVRWALRIGWLTGLTRLRAHLAP